MDILESWCKKMEETAVRRLTLANIIYDCRTKRIPKKLFRSLLDEIMKKWEISGKYGSPEGIIGDVIDKAPHKYLCCGQSRIKNTQGISRVIESVTFLTKNVNLALSGGLLSDHVDDEQIEYWEAEGFKTGEVIGEMRSAKPLAWVTKSKELTALREDSDPKRFPNAVRNALGLRHYNGEEKLLEICYPEGALCKSRLVPPTFIEGSPSLIYCSKKKKDGWGRTVHLQNLDEGLSEAVHPPIKFTEQFKIKKIGRLTESCPFVKFEELEKRHPNGVGSNNYLELKKYL